MRITLVDRRNHHVFQPLLYQVATAGLAAPDIAAPIRHILRGQRNATVILAEVTGFDLRRRKVRLDRRRARLRLRWWSPRGPATRTSATTTGDATRRG